MCNRKIAVLQVLAVASDQNLGGRDFDKLIVDHFIGEWRTKYKVDAMTRMKAYISISMAMPLTMADIRKMIGCSGVAHQALALTDPKMNPT